MFEPSEPMSARFSLEYGFKRSLGPVLGRFFTSLRNQKLEGIRASDGSVLFPPTEYDPSTGAELRDFVEVAPSGVVTSHTWVAEPERNHPLQTPFAFALIKLDGASTPFLHVVSVPSREHLETGMRVRVQWSEERGQGIRDIACFVAETAA